MRSLSWRPATRVLISTLWFGPCADAYALDLLQTYDQALQQDPRLRRAEATRNASLETKPQSIAQLLPTLSISAGMNRNDVNSKNSFIQGQTGVLLHFWDSQASVTLRQPIYHAEFWVQLSQADHQIAAAEAAYEAEHQNLILRTAQAYFEIRFAHDVLAFARMELQSTERQLRQAQDRYEVGLVARTEVDAARAAYDLTRSNVITAENDLDRTREALREIIGAVDATLSGLSDEIPLQGPQPDSLDAWANRALESNLAIIAARNQLDVARKDVDLRFTGHLPTVDLVGSAGFNDTNRPRGNRTESQVIGVQVNIPLFQGGAVSSRVRQAEQLAQAAAENLDIQQRAASRQVKDAYRGVLASIAKVDALKSAVVSAESALETARDGFEVGTRTMVEVLTQQRNLYAAKRDYARARYDYLLNSLSLKQAASILTRDDLAWINRLLVAEGKDG